MSCCCTKVYRICDVVVCDDLDLVLPVPVPADGEYTLELDFLGDIVTRTAQLTAGNNATFEKGQLNEKFTYLGHVRNPAGEIVTFIIDEIEYDCIEFTTQRAHTWSNTSASS